MKTFHLRFKFILVLTAALPLPIFAEVSLPRWLDPNWIQEKLLDIHLRNTERIEAAQAQAQAQAKKNGSTSVNSNVNANANAAGSVNANGKDKTALAPVETAQPKMNEKYLSKEELSELRRQLRQNP
jgi:hypothetical protein